MKECTDIVFSSIKGVKEDQQTAAKTLKFVLPVNQVNNFGSLFAKL